MTNGHHYFNLNNKNMKTTINKILVFVFATVTLTLTAQKKVQSFSISRVIDSNIESVWNVV